MYLFRVLVGYTRPCSVVRDPRPYTIQCCIGKLTVRRIVVIQQLNTAMLSLSTTWNIVTVIRIFARIRKKSVRNDNF